MLALFVALGKLVSLAMGFVVPVVLVRVLDKSDFGLYSQFNMIVLSVATFFGFGFRSNLVFFYNKVEKDQIGPAVVHTVLIIVILGLLSIYFINTSFFQRYFLGENAGLHAVIDLLALAVLFQMVSSVTETLYVVKRDKLTGLFYPAFSVVIRALLVVCAAYSFGAFGAAAKGLVVALFILVLFNGYYLFSELKNNTARQWLRPGLIKQQVYYATPFGLSNSVKEVSLKFDKYMALSFLSPSVYASYSVAFTSIPGVMAVYDSLANVYLMDMVREYKHGKKEKVVDIYKNLVAKSLSFTIPLITLFVFYADIIIPFVFTEKYSDSILLFRIYIPSLIFFVLGADLAIRASGKTSLSLRAQIFSLSLSLPATYLLIVNFGVKGAAIGAVIASVLPTVLLVSYSVRILETNLWSFFPWKKILAVVIITIMGFIPIWVLSEVFGKDIETFLLCMFISGSVVLFLEYRFDLLLVDRQNIDSMRVKLVRLRK